MGNAPERRDECTRAPTAALPKTALAGLLAVVLAAAAAVGVPAAAQSSGEWVATVRGEARAPLPPRSSLTVSAEDDDDVNMRLQGVIEQRLRENGYGVGESGGSGLQLWFDTELARDTVGAEPARPENATEVGAPPVDEEMLGRGTGAVGSDDRAEVDVAPEATVPFGVARPGAPGTRYSLTFIVGRPGEPPIWEGSVTTRIGSEDPFEVAEAMVPLLVDQIGKTTRAQSTFP